MDRCKTIIQALLTVFMNAGIPEPRLVMVTRHTDVRRLVRSVRRFP